MIVLDKRSWVKMVFAIRGSSLNTTWPRILLVTSFASLVTWAYIEFDLKGYSLTTTPFALIGTAMAIFLGFRNNESYNRFWEGRKLWGSLVNVSRSFARQCETLLDSGTENDPQVRETRDKIVRATIAYVHAFRHHLRESDPSEELSAYLDEDERQHLNVSNVPIAILQRIGLMVRDAWKAGYILDYHVPIFEGSLSEMTNVQGGCERIKNTPLPFPYNVLIHRIVAVYCLAMPFGLLESAGALTPVVVCLISYAFFGLDAIGDDVEQPFEIDDNDLPLHALSRTIEINLLEAIGADRLPEPIAAEHGVLQ